MKKTAALLLLGIMLFNWLGYQLYYATVQHLADKRMEARIDQNRLTASEVVTLKVPLHLPYLPEASTFQRVSGELVINGIHYKYFERRIIDDSLELKCVADQEKTNLANAKIEYLKATNNVQQGPGHSKTQLSFKSLFPEFVNSHNVWKMAPHSPFPLEIFYDATVDKPSCLFVTGPVKPPEASFTTI